MKNGDRVRLVFCEDEGAPAPGSEGIVSFINDRDTVFVDWDNGTRLGMIARAGDRIELVSSPDIKVALAMWENAVVNAHGGNARKTPLLVTAQLIEAGDKLAEILKEEGS